jgi:hypothetical protein
LVETKKKGEKYYKFVNMNVMALQDLLVRTFKNCSKIHGFLNPLFINQIFKKPFQCLLKIRRIKKIQKTCAFVFLNDGTPNFLNGRSPIDGFVL